MKEGKDMYDCTDMVVEITIDRVNGRVWVNVEGQCKLRAYKCKEIYLDGGLISDQVKEPTP